MNLHIAPAADRTMPLYQTERGAVHAADVLRTFRSLGVAPGDVLLVHSDVSVFGKLASFNRDLILGSLSDVLKAAVGEAGTLVIPTFSYSFCRNERYDRENTPSTVGALTEYFRKLPGVRRTMHPIFSFAAWGRHRDRLMVISKDSFDRDSVFGAVHALGGKIMFLGASFESCTFVHYLEQAHGVPYRYVKTFRGVVRDGEREYHDQCTYLVRYLDRNVDTNLSRLEARLRDLGFLRGARVGSGSILAVDADQLYREGWNMLDRDIFSFLKPPYPALGSSRGSEERPA